MKRKGGTGKPVTADGAAYDTLQARLALYREQEGLENRRHSPTWEEQQRKWDEDQRWWDEDFKHGHMESPIVVQRMEQGLYNDIRAELIAKDEQDVAQAQEEAERVWRVFAAVMRDPTREPDYLEDEAMLHEYLASGHDWPVEQVDAWWRDLSRLTLKRVVAEREKAGLQ